MEASSMCHTLLYFHGFVFLATCMCAFVMRKPITTAIKLVAPIVRARLNTTPGSYVLHTVANEHQAEEELPPDTNDELTTVSEIDATENMIGMTHRKRLKFP